MTRSSGRSCQNVGRFAVVLLAGAVGIVGSSFGNQERRPLAPLTLEELHEFDLIALLPPREQQREGSGSWRLNAVAREVGRRAREGRLSDRAWTTLLMGEDLIHTRSRWPVDAPLMIWIRQPAWISPRRIVVEAIDPPLGTVQVPATGTRCGLAAAGARRRLLLGSLPVGTKEITFRVSIEGMEDPETPHRFSSDETLSGWEGRLRVAVEAVSSIENCVPRVAGPELDAAIRTGMSASLEPSSIFPDSWHQLTLEFARHSAFAGVGVSFGAEVLWKGQILERFPVITTARRGSVPIPRRLATDPVEIALLEIRIRGTSDDILGAWEVDRWWDGELTIPLAELIERGR